jgi:hypothetical protein
MNWRRLHATLEIWGTVGLFTFVGAGFWAFIVAGLCRIAFRLGDTEALLLIGVPMSLGVGALLIRLLPSRLRRAGMLSDEPAKFGPWFR